MASRPPRPGKPRGKPQPRPPPEPRADDGAPISRIPSAVGSAPASSSPAAAALADEAKDVIVIKLFELPAKFSVAQFGLDAAISVPAARGELLALDALDDAALADELARARASLAAYGARGMRAACEDHRFFRDTAVYVCALWRLGHIVDLPVVEGGYYEDDNPPPPESYERPGGSDLRPHDLVAILNREGSGMDPGERRKWNETLASTQADAHDGFVHDRSIFRPVPK
jgi:hypothetical protein